MTDIGIVNDLLARYPAPMQLRNTHPWASTGFSGARLWHVDSPVGPFCLRAWPAHVTVSRLEELHRLMTLARGQGLGFVPAVFATREGITWSEGVGRLWGLTEWLPGRADYLENPSRRRLESACVALAQLHRAWQLVATGTVQGVCPAAGRRLDSIRAWQQLLRSGWEPRFLAGDADPVHPVARRAWRLLPSWMERIQPNLESFTRYSWMLQPCHCDPWHDNLLFEGERLTGIVDYGSVKVDHVAVDLARLLGSLVEDDVDGWRIGLEAYRGVCLLSPHEEELAHSLDWTGTVVGVVQWLRWLYEEGREFKDRGKVAARLDVLVRRVEQWGSSNKPGAPATGELFPPGACTPGL